MEQETLIQTEAPVRERRLYIESYGCAMNFSDSEIVATIMQENGFRPTTEEHEADVIFLNTCAIRDNAEQRIRERLKHLRGNKKRKGDLIIGAGTKEPGADLPIQPPAGGQHDHQVATAR